MQTFLPCSSFYYSALCLDTKRLGKQRVEALQLLNAIQGKSIGWVNHPAAIMWRNHVDALKLYHDACIDAWVYRGFKNNMPKLGLDLDINVVKMPSFIGHKPFHLSHQSNLVRKFPEHYRLYFPDVPDDLPYLWPV